MQTHSFSRLDDDDDEAAPVGVHEVKSPEMYVHPRYSRIAFWILPGIGSPKYSDVEIYCKELQLKKCFDVFLFFSSTRLFQLETILIKEITRWQKNKIFFVRTMIDNDVRCAQRKKRFDESALLERIRFDWLKRLEGLLSNPKDIFLISSDDPEKWDFRRLEKAILDLHEQWASRLDSYGGTPISGTRANVILI